MFYKIYFKWQSVVFTGCNHFIIGVSKNDKYIINKVRIDFVKQLAEKESVTKEPKATDQMLGVQRMNNIRNSATEIVNAELIYTV